MTHLSWRSPPAGLAVRVATRGTASGSKNEPTVLASCFGCWNSTATAKRHPPKLRLSL